MICDVTRDGDTGAQYLVADCKFSAFVQNYGPANLEEFCDVGSRVAVMLSKLTYF